MNARPCLGCGDVISSGTYCPDCQPADTRTKSNTDHPAFKNNARWKNLSRRLRRMSPFCERCGSTEQLSVDHIVRVKDRPEWAYEIANLRVLCLSCNGKISGQPATPEQIAAIETKINSRKRRTRKSLVADKTRGDTPPPPADPTRPQARRALHTASDSKIYGLGGVR